jgi:hypothetical protein
LAVAEGCFKQVSIASSRSGQWLVILTALSLRGAVQDPCTVVLAGAGCTMGLLGPFMMDILLNFDAIR